MALFKLMGKYSPAALKAIIETGSDREAATRTALEAAGGKLLGFYGMFGQEYQVAIIADLPGNAEYIGALAPALISGTLTDYKTIPLYTSAAVLRPARSVQAKAAASRGGGQGLGSGVVPNAAEPKAAGSGGLRWGV